LDKKNDITYCLCFKKKRDLEAIKRQRLMNELVNDAPTKEELGTHDGVVFFPKELIPPEDEEKEGTGPQANDIKRLSVTGKHVLMKSKKLNLKLKFKTTAAYRNAMSHIGTSKNDLISGRHSMMLAHQAN